MEPYNREQENLRYVIVANLVESVVEYQAPVVVQFAPVYTAAVIVVKREALLSCNLPAALFMLRMSTRLGRSFVLRT